MLLSTRIFINNDEICKLSIYLLSIHSRFYKNAELQKVNRNEDCTLLYLVTMKLFNLAMQYVFSSSCRVI